jgi:hypothetical protein
MERDLIVGGQAVMEGVMMRTPSAYAIACRKSDGEIVTTAEALPKWSDKYKWLSWPVLRGGATLIQSMALGIKALNFSARVYEEDLKAQEELAKEKVVEIEPVLAEGTTDENFTKAPAKVVMPEKKEEKKMAQSGRSDRRDRFRARIEHSSFHSCSADLDQHCLHRARLGAGSRHTCRRRLVVDRESLPLGS